MEKNSLNLHVVPRYLNLGDTTYKLDFDMMALSYTEQVYAEKYQRNVNVATIATELFQVKMGAVMAFTYGAIVSGGASVTWEKFSKEIFTYENFDEVFRVVSGALEELFGFKDENGKGGDVADGDSKN